MGASLQGQSERKQAEDELDGQPLTGNSTEAECKQAGGTGGSGGEGGGKALADCSRSPRKGHSY